MVSGSIGVQVSAMTDDAYSQLPPFLSLAAAA